MIKTRYILVITGFMILKTSCNKIVPAGFWENFHKDLIATKNSNQGPWGGSKEVYWKSETQNTFTDIEVIEYAKRNNWILTDSITLSADMLAKSDFPELKNDDYSLEIIKEKALSKARVNANKLLVFKTTWLAVEPGNSRETFENGFAIINSNGTELEIYHLWGE